MLKQEGKVDTEEESKGEETKNQLRDECIAEMKRVLKEEELAMKHARLQTKEENRNKMKEEEDRLIQEYEEAMNRITEGKMEMKSSANMQNQKIQEMEDMLREDTHKKSVFLVVGPLRFYPPYTNGLVVNATFFFFFFVL